MRKLLKLYMLATILVVHISVFAQDETLNPGPVDELPDETQAPIDGGVSLLVAAGVIYGAKKAHKQIKKLKESYIN